MAVLSVHRAILNAVRDQIISLGLRGLDAENVQVLKTNVRREEVQVGVPGVLIAHPANAVEEYSTTAGVCQFDDIGYPVLVTVLANDRGDGTGRDNQIGTQDQLLNHDIYLWWREAIRKSFINQPLDAVSTVFMCEWRPRRLVDESEWRRRNLWASSLVFTFWSREARASIVSEASPPGTYVDTGGSPYLE